MAVYVDEAEWPWRGKLWAHLQADSIAELHAFALKLGLRREWFQKPPKASSPHYDVTAAVRREALRLGAIPSDRRTVSALAKKLRAEFEASQSAPTSTKITEALQPEKATAQVGRQASLF